MGESGLDRESAVSAAATLVLCTTRDSGSADAFTLLKSVTEEFLLSLRITKCSSSRILHTLLTLDDVIVSLMGGYLSETSD